MSTEPELTYEQAAARIEAIIRRLDSGEAGLRETLDLVREGRDLVEYCAGELEAVGRGLEELELDELDRPARGRARRALRRRAARSRALTTSVPACSGPTGSASVR